MPPRAKEKAGKATKAGKAGKVAKAAASAVGASRRPAAVRTLWLLRHAKTVTEPPPGGTDFDRVLAPRGRRDAIALGELFAGHGEGLGAAFEGVPRPAVALVSPAARTSETAELVLGAMAEPASCRYDQDLYGAEPDEVLAFVRSLPDEAAAAMVVGHNPTAYFLSQGLLSPRDKKGLSLAVRQGFPTCALGVYTFPVEHWADVTTRSATLVTLVVPPYTPAAEG
jgi:phosphohistidine phosphatase